MILESDVTYCNTKSSPYASRRVGLEYVCVFGHDAIGKLVDGDVGV